MAKSILTGVALFGALMLAVGSVRAQTGADNQGESSSARSYPVSEDQDIALLRKDIRSKKKQLITESLKLSDADAARFWPVYDQYTADLIKNQRREIRRDQRI